MCSSNTNGWTVDEDSWNTPSESILNPSNSDPWFVPSGSTDEVDETVLSADDFSSFTQERCNDLVKNADDTTKVTLPSPLPQPLVGSFLLAGKTSKQLPDNFEPDKDYLGKLENKLDKLYRLKGKAEKRSMLKQVQDRADMNFMTDTTHRQDSSIEEPIHVNPLTKMMFPQHQALTTEEKLKLVKFDQLAEQFEQLDYKDTLGDITDQPCDGDCPQPFETELTNPKLQSEVQGNDDLPTQDEGL